VLGGVPPSNRLPRRPDMETYRDRSAPRVAWSDRSLAHASGSMAVATVISRVTVTALWLPIVLSPFSRLPSCNVPTCSGLPQAPDRIATRSTPTVIGRLTFLM